MDFLNAMTGKTAPNPEDAEVKIDLSGMEKDAALQKLNASVVQCKLSRAASLYVCFDPARPGGGETLFQPVMRYFKVEKWNGYLAHATPVMTQETSGVFAVFKV